MKYSEYVRLKNVLTSLKFFIYGSFLGFMILLLIPFLTDILFMYMSIRLKGAAEVVGSNFLFLIINNFLGFVSMLFLIPLIVSFVLKNETEKLSSTTKYLLTKFRKIKTSDLSVKKAYVIAEAGPRIIALVVGFYMVGFLFAYYVLEEGLGSILFNLFYFLPHGTIEAGILLIATTISLSYADLLFENQNKRREELSLLVDKRTKSKFILHIVLAGFILTITAALLETNVSVEFAQNAIKILGS